jgi:hypothetical protein
MTPEFKAHFQDNYGPSYSVRRPDYTKCAEHVPDGLGRVTFHQCTRKNGHGPDGAYCKTHDPVARKVKSDASYAAFRAEQEAKNASRDLRNDCLEAIRQIAAGHNDPRSLAVSILGKYEKP